MTARRRTQAELAQAIEAERARRASPAYRQWIKVQREDSLRKAQAAKAAQNRLPKEKRAAVIRRDPLVVFRYRWAIGLYRRGFTLPEVDSVLGTYRAVPNALEREPPERRHKVYEDHKAARAKRRHSSHRHRAGKLSKRVVQALDRLLAAEGVSA